MSDVSKRLEEQADLLFNNVTGWETNALRRIGRRVKSIKSLSHADLQALNNATIAKQDIDAILKELAKLTNQTVPEIKRIYSEMIKQQHEENRTLYDYRNKPFVPFADNKSLQAIVRAYARTTADTMIKLSMTKAKQLGFADKNGNFVPIEKNFIQVLDKAVMSIATGTGDFGSEMRDVLKELGGSGLRIDYGGNVTRRLDTMVRQNLLWGAKQASISYNEMIGEELGCDGIEIDWHSNPRPSHEFMQGKQYSLKGKQTINGVTYEGADDALVALNDYGCLHFKTPIILGVSEPRYSSEELARLNEENKRTFEINGKQLTGYEAKQVMRRLETEARKTKDQINILKASGDNTGAQQLRHKVSTLEGKYQRIAQLTGLKAQPEKMTVIKTKFVDNSIKSGIIKEQSKKEVTPITETSIKNVPKLNIGGFNDVQCETIQQQHIELLEYSRDKNANKEVAFVFRDGLEDREVFVGTDDEIDFGNKLIGKGEKLLVMHNHPRNSSYSIKDIAFFLTNDCVKTFSICKNSGYVEVLTKTENYNMNTIKTDVARLAKKYVKQGTESEYDTIVLKLLTKYSKEGGMFEWIK